jgi:hypothetical protein
MLRAQLGCRHLSRSSRMLVQHARARAVPPPCMARHVTMPKPGSATMQPTCGTAGAPALLVCLRDLPPPPPREPAPAATSTAAGGSPGTPTGEPADTRDEDHKPQESGGPAAADLEKPRPLSSERLPRPGSSDALQAAAEADQANAGAESSTGPDAEGGGENASSGAGAAPAGLPEQQQGLNGQQAAEPAGLPPRGPVQELLLFLGHVPEALDGCRCWCCRAVCLVRAASKCSPQPL